MKRIQVFFSGTVQGVGFRATTRDLAEEIGLVGWVRNLADGRVEMVAEGHPENLGRLVNELDERFSVRGIQEKEIEGSENFAEFEIRH